MDRSEWNDDGLGNKRAMGNVLLWGPESKTKVPGNLDAKKSNGYHLVGFVSPTMNAFV